jgi:hypothetical protein
MKVLVLAVALAACGGAQPPAFRSPGPKQLKFVALPVESPNFPNAAKLATDLLRRARLKDMPEPTMTKVSIEIVQLQIECVEPTETCYEAVGKTLSADLLLFGELEAGPREGQVKFTVSLFDVGAKAYRKRSAKMFATEEDAAYDMKLVVQDATKP